MTFFLILQATSANKDNDKINKSISRSQNFNLDRQKAHILTAKTESKTGSNNVQDVTAYIIFNNMNLLTSEGT